MASSSSRRLFGQGFSVLMAAAKKSTATTTTATPTPTATVTAKVATKGKGVGISKPVSVTPALGEFLGGVSESSRTGAVKKVWDYIKLNNLQNPSNKKEIICDDKLKTIFDGKDQVNFLEIAKLLNQHFVKATK